VPGYNTGLYSAIPRTPLADEPVGSCLSRRVMHVPAPKQYGRRCLCDGLLRRA